MSVVPPRNIHLMLIGSSFPLVCMLFATTAIMTTSSRMCYAFARYVIRTHNIHFLLTQCSDGGLPASPFFSKVHPKLKVPLNSLYLNLALVIIFGLIFLGSDRSVVSFLKISKY